MDKFTHKQARVSMVVECVHCDREQPNWKVKDLNLTLGKSYTIEGVCLGDDFIMIVNDVGNLDWFRTFKFKPVQSTQE